MDEPENRLHPAAFRDVINRIAEVVSEGQIWIATHSIPLLAFIDERDLHFVLNGRVDYAGREPERVMISLLGDETERAKLVDFVGRADQLAMARYSAECLIPPQPVDTTSNDPQLTSIRNFVSEGRTSEPLKILDFGAGRGRLVGALKQDHNSHTIVEYHAFDQPNSEHKDVCLRAMNEFCEGKSIDRYHESLTGTIPQKYFDLVVLCNVLHEIDPMEWVKVLKKEILPLLKGDGQILILEDLKLPVGEMAHRFGFLMLTVEAAKAFFKVDDSLAGFKVEFAERYDGRLVVYAVKAELLERIDAESLRSAANVIVDESESKIRDLRNSKSSSYRAGKAMMLAHHQFAAASMVLNELSL